MATGVAERKRSGPTVGFLAVIRGEPQQRQAGANCELLAVWSVSGLRCQRREADQSPSVVVSAVFRRRGTRRREDGQQSYLRPQSWSEAPGRHGIRARGPKRALPAS